MINSLHKFLTSKPVYIVTTLIGLAGVYSFWDKPPNVKLDVTDSPNSINTVNQNGDNTLVANASTETPTEKPDGLRREFTFIHRPKIIFVDGGRMIQATSSDGTINWTYEGQVATVVIAPNFDIYSVY